jgi:hypothetical protein
VHTRRGPALVCAALTVVVTLVAGCSEDGKDDDPKPETTSGLLTAGDMPFENAKVDPLARPPVLSQLGTTCLGLEQGPLYDAGWDVTARQLYDSFEWSVISAVLTPPSGITAAEGIDQARSGVGACAPKEKGARVTVLDLGGSTFGYQVTTPDGAFNAARAYRAIPGGKLAQVSVMKLPAGQDATKVLGDLLDDVD